MPSERSYFLIELNFLKSEIFTYIYGDQMVTQKTRLELPSPNCSCQKSWMPKRILLIDDEIPLRRIVELTLYLTAGWEVLAVGSGQEGLQQAEIEQPDAILLDLMMPDMDGMTTLSRLKENTATQHIPVIVMTAKVQALYQFEYRQLGIAAIFIKPFEPTTLVQQVKAALGWD